MILFLCMFNYIIVKKHIFSILALNPKLEWPTSGSGGGGGHTTGASKITMPSTAA